MLPHEVWLHCVTPCLQPYEVVGVVALLSCSFRAMASATTCPDRPIVITDTDVRIFTCGDVRQAVHHIHIRSPWGWHASSEIIPQYDPDAHACYVVAGRRVLTIVHSSRMVRSIEHVPIPGNAAVWDRRRRRRPDGDERGCVRALSRNCISHHHKKHIKN